MKFNLLVTLILFCAVFEVNSQKPNHSGFTYFSEYNSKLITPETSQKHVISFGTGINQFTSRLTAPTTTIYNGEINSTVPLWRVGLGYHYLFFKNKNLPLFKKKEEI